MEAEPLELEDGEVVDDEPLDGYETYNILERPHTVRTVEEPNKMGYSDDTDDSPDSESDSDSDSNSARAIAKRPKLKIKRCKSKQRNSKSNDKYKVWCTQVQEESLTEDLISCGVTKRVCGDRNVEDYDFTLRYTLRGVKSTANSSEEEREETETRLTNKRTNSDRRNVKLRLGKRKNSMEVDGQKGSVRIIAELTATAESTDDDVATDIASKLNEKKDSLIRKVVDIIGKEKAIDFYLKTKKIEEDGGMLIMNGSRRRTAGGVYLFLVKNDEHLPQEKIREIFFCDKKEQTEHKKKSSAEARRQKTQEFMRSFENGSDKDLPALLTRAELSTRQIAEEARLRRGEGMERAPLDSERTVSNPPPSPVTDDPDHSEQPLTQRRVNTYADDFLDIGVDVDSMELF